LFTSVISAPFAIAKGPVLAILANPNGFNSLIKRSISLLVELNSTIKEVLVVSRYCAPKELQIFLAFSRFFLSVITLINANSLKIYLSSTLKEATL
jgi:hypothetical protein